METVKTKYRISRSLKGDELQYIVRRGKQTTPVYRGSSLEEAQEFIAGPVKVASSEGTTDKSKKKDKKSR